MKKFLKGIAVAAGFAWAAGATAEIVGNADAGKEKAAACGACHGADGNSAVPSFPKIAGQGSKYLIKQMNDVMSGLRVIPEMTGQLDSFSEQDVANVAAYFASQTIVVSQANPELIEHGKQIYRSGIPAKSVAACTACHGPAGQGVDLAVFPALGGQHAEYTGSQLMKFRSGERMNGGDTRIMRSIAARLSDKEIEAVSSYISGLYR